MPQTLKSVRVERNGLSRDILYRPGPSDERSLAQVFKLGHYNLPALERFPELLALVEAEAAQGLRLLIIDGGANIGSAAIFFHLFFPTAHLILPHGQRPTVK